MTELPDHIKRRAAQIDRDVAAIPVGSTLATAPRSTVPADSFPTAPTLASALEGSALEAPDQAAPEPRNAKIYQLALWPSEKRAMPTEFARSALFSAVQGKDATYLERVEIVNANDLRIIYTGHRLTQVHADVWEGIMLLARGMRESTKITFTARRFLKLIGRHTGKCQREDLKLWFSHLTATSLEVHDRKNQRRYWGSLLPSGAAQDESDDALYVVEINRDLAKLFDRGFSLVDWEQRKRLMRKPLCLWLQHHFSAFSKPVTIRELHTLSGSTAKNVWHFRAKLKTALGELQAAQVLSGWRIDDATDSVHVTLTTDPARSVNQTSRPPPVPPAAQPPLVVSARAKETFKRRYPGKEPDQCIRDWLNWLTNTGQTAERPDAAFLGFAKGWIADQSDD